MLTNNFENLAVNAFIVLSTVLSKRRRVSNILFHM